MCYALLTTVVVVVLLSGQWERDSWKGSSDQFGSFLTEVFEAASKEALAAKETFPSKLSSLLPPPPSSAAFISRGDTHLCQHGF